MISKVNSLIDTIDKIQSKSFRDIPVYDKVGNRLSVAKSTLSGVEGQTYAYDNIYQLTGVSGSQQRGYVYDSVGNREASNEGAMGPIYETNNLNQYTNVGDKVYSYDARGNLTSDGINSYTYDVENRLITASGGGQSEIRAVSQIKYKAG